MVDTPEVAVTLSPDLFAQLCREADSLEVPLEWLVASLVADTLDEPSYVDADCCEPALAC